MVNRGPSTINNGKMAVCPYKRKKYERIFSYKNYFNERFEIASNQAGLNGLSPDTLRLRVSVRWTLGDSERRSGPSGNPWKVNFQVKKLKNNSKSDPLRKCVFKNAVSALLYPHREHNLVMWTASSPVYCSTCEGLLWGITKETLQFIINDLIYDDS